MTDGYQVYHTLEGEREDLEIARCWVHCRRRYDKAVKPLVDTYFNWVRINIEKVMQKRKTHNGMTYSLKHQEKYLRRFLDDGEIPIDNNAVEQNNRNFCICKKNWVMCDTINGPGQVPLFTA